MRSTRSRCLRLSLALGITVSAASLLLGLGGGDVALLDFAPFLALLCLTLVLPEAAVRAAAARARAPAAHSPPRAAPRAAPSPRARETPTRPLGPAPAPAGHAPMCRVYTE